MFQQLTIGAALGDWALTSTPPHGNTVDDVALEMESSDIIYHLKNLIGRKTTLHKTMTIPVWPCSRACVPCQAWLALGHGAPG